MVVLVPSQRRVDLRCYGIGSLFEVCWPGYAPGGAPTFFASPKKVGKERRADVRAPSLRYGVPCAARVRRGLAELALRAQTTPALIHLPLRCSALPQRRRPEYPRFTAHRQLAAALVVRGHRWDTTTKPDEPRPGGPTNLTDKRCAHPRSNAPRYSRRHASASSAATGGSGLALFERSEFSQTPPGASNAVCP